MSAAEVDRARAERVACHGTIAVHDYRCPTPECDKLAAGAVERDTINAFLDWLVTQGLHLAEECDEYRPQPRLVPAGRSHDNLALAYLGVDPVALERERRALLAENALRDLHRKARG